MPSLNERLRQLERMKPERSVWDMLSPDQQVDVLQETIRCLERDVAEGRGGEPFGSGPDVQTVAETLPIWREWLADWESEHGITH